MLKTTLVKSLLSAAIMAGLASPMAVQAQTAGMNTPAASALNKADAAIVMDMARANMAEVEAGKMAVSKSQNAEVKGFAQRMIDDHSKALNDVTQLAQNKGVTMPTEPDAKHKAMAAKLGKLEGEKFDREYMKKAGVEDHTKVHAALKKYEAKAKDPDVKALAAKMMPTVEQHLNAAKGMKMPSTQKGSSSSATTMSSGAMADHNMHTADGKVKKPPVVGEATDHTSPGATKPPPGAKDTSKTPGTK
ncbi:MAG: DUF4142 domain-containing protein [Telluria sp.]